MTHDEMRAIRRQYINSIIHENHFLRLHGKPIFQLHHAKARVREFEYVNFGYELKAYG